MHDKHTRMSSSSVTNRLGRVAPIDRISYSERGRYRVRRMPYDFTTLSPDDTDGRAALRDKVWGSSMASYLFG